MPNPLTSPIIPQSWVDAANQWAQPGLNTSPAIAALKGFGAGALQGIRGMSSPLSIAGAALPEVMGPAEAAPAVTGLMDALGPASDLSAAGEAMGTSAAGANDMMNPSSL